jgi:hypothetical protein
VVVRALRSKGLRTAQVTRAIPHHSDLRLNQQQILHLDRTSVHVSSTREHWCLQSEPGEEVVSNNIEIAIALGDDDLGPAPPQPAGNTPDAGEIERADVASAKATQWTDHAGKPPARSAAENDAQLEDAVRSGDANAVTSAFLADLLSED